jgi:acid phosphatase (class A)
MSLPRLAPFGFATLLLAGCALSDPLAAPRPKVAVETQAGGSTAWTQPPAGYLTAANAFDGAAIVGPPPTPDSARGKADRAAYDQGRKLVNTPIWRRAITDADLSGAEGFKSFSCAAGVTIGPESTPTLARLMLRMTSDAATVYEPAKATFQRPRPPVGNSKPICVPREAWLNTSGSYPSGHGMIGWSWALVVSELAPDRTANIMSRGRDFGDSRVVCGVHFPSDIEAGRLLAGAMVARLHADPAFTADLATAKAEVAASKAKGPPTGCGA